LGLLEKNLNADTFAAIKDVVGADKLTIEDLNRVRKDIEEVSFDPFLTDALSVGMLNKVSNMDKDRPQDRILFNVPEMIDPTALVLGCYMGKKLGEGGFGAAYLADNKLKTVVKIERAHRPNP
jgi:hypothetical protein